MTLGGSRAPPSGAKDTRNGPSAAKVGNGGADARQTHGARERGSERFPSRGLGPFPGATRRIDAAPHIREPHGADPRSVGNRVVRGDGGQTRCRADATHSTEVGSKFLSAHVHGIRSCAVVAEAATGSTECCSRDCALPPPATRARPQSVPRDSRGRRPWPTHASSGKAALIGAPVPANMRVWAGIARWKTSSGVLLNSVRHAEKGANRGAPMRRPVHMQALRSGLGVRRWPLSTWHRRPSTREMKLWCSRRLVRRAPLARVLYCNPSRPPPSAALLRPPSLTKPPSCCAEFPRNWHADSSQRTRPVGRCGLAGWRGKRCGGRSIRIPK